MEIRSSQIRLKKTSAVAVSGLAGGVLAESTAQATHTVLHQLSDRVDLTSLPKPQNSPLINSLLSGSGLALASGALSGVGLAAGAVWGEKPVDLQDKSWWKKVAFGGPVNLFNSGIKMREDMRNAVQQDDLRSRFSGGAAVGFRAGSRVGGAAGKVQGALTGGYLGYQFSGQAVALVERFLEATPLPRPLQQMLPLAVTAACIVTGQGVGGMVGQTVGQITGGAIGGLAGGLYASAAAPTLSAGPPS